MEHDHGHSSSAGDIHRGCRGTVLDGRDRFRTFLIDCPNTKCTTKPESIEHGKKVHTWLMEAVGFEFALNKVVAKEIRGGKEISTELVLPSREISLRVNDALGSLQKPLSFNGSPIYIKLKKVGVEADRENKFKCALKCLHDLGTSAGKVKGDYRNEHINLICDEQTITLLLLLRIPSVWLL